jgi:hypothetical protein
MRLMQAPCQEENRVFRAFSVIICKIRFDCAEKRQLPPDSEHIEEFLHHQVIGETEILAALGMKKLLIPQRHHRIHARCASRGDKTRDEHNQRHHHCHRCKGKWISRTHAIEQRGHQS